MEGVVFEGKALRPIRVHPFGGHGGVDGEGASEVAVEFPVQGTKTLSGLRQRVLRMFQPDHANGTLRTPPTLSRAVGLVDHRGSDKIAVADSHVHKHGARIERAEQPVEIVQELPVLMEVSELGKLQVRDPQGLTRDLREIVAKTGALHLDALLTGQHATGVCVEFSRNGRQRDGLRRSAPGSFGRPGGVVR